MHKNACLYCEYAVYNNQAQPQYGMEEKKNNCCQHAFVFAMDLKTKKSSKSKMGKNKLLQTLRNIIHCDTRVHFKFPKHLIRYATGN